MDKRKQPNILWICTDQQRFDTLGCYGNRFVNTPNLDGLAERGMLMEHAYCQNPVCTPSRASFLTGRYPRTTLCRQNGQSIPEHEVLVTRVLADNGYTCGLSGKLHISPCSIEACPVTERRINDGYSVFHWCHHPVSIGSEGDQPGNEYSSWLRSQGKDMQWTPFSESSYIRLGQSEEYHQTTWCANKAIDFIKHLGGIGKPWLFSVNIFDPHHVFDPPENYLERYRSILKDIPLPNYIEGELDNKPFVQGVDHQGAYGGRKGNYTYDDMGDDDHRWVHAAYWAMCDLIDAQVGRMLDALKETGQADNTIVIFMSDHGEMLGDHGIYLKGPYFYEPAVHVPLIISWPEGNIKGGKRSRALIELVDLAPTLLEAAGLPQPPGMQGKSLLPLLTGQSDPDLHREDVYSEFYNSNFHKQTKPFTTMIRTDRYKLTVLHGHDSGELYDLLEDPNETHNKWTDPSLQAVKVEMLRRMCDRMAWTSDPLPPREAPW